jgi:hypothetical protein
MNMRTLAKSCGAAWFGAIALACGPNGPLEEDLDGEPWGTSRDALTGCPAPAENVWPVVGSPSWPDTFGACRGSGCSRRHEGNDIFAPTGTPLVATQDGVIDGLGYKELGGNSFHVESAGGLRYYYAHLDAYAPGIRNGVTVRRGQLVGFVGKTGNAVSTPPHLHFEISVNDEPQDPYGCRTAWSKNSTDVHPEAPVVVEVRASSANPAGMGYSVDTLGKLYPFGGAPDVAYNDGNGGTQKERWNFVIARAVATRDDGKSGYVVDGYGGLHAFGGAPNVTSASYWRDWDIVRDIVLRRDGQSGYVLDGYGGLHPFGGAPSMTGGPYWKDWDIARRVVLRHDGTSGYVLDGLGGVHAFGGAPRITNGPYWNWDIARDIVLGIDDKSGYVLDGFGAVHAFGGAPPVRWSMSRYAQKDLARGIVLMGEGRRGQVYGSKHEVSTFYIPEIRDVAVDANANGYKLNEFGDIIPVGNAPAVTYNGPTIGEEPWNFSIARAIALRGDGRSGYVLDGYGAIHPFGGAPKVTSTSYWSGWDIARDLVLRQDGQSGYVLDGYGGIHPFGGAPPVTDGPYWRGWEIAKSFALRADGKSGYVLDGYGAVHPFGGAPAAMSTGYHKDWDIARDILIAADGKSGYVLDGWGSISPFGGAPAVRDAGAYFPRWDVVNRFASPAPSAAWAVKVDAWGGVHRVALR